LSVVIFWPILLARGGLRVAAAQVARRQHGGGAHVVEHGLGGEADLAEQALGAAAREVEHRVRLVRLTCGLRITGMTMVVLDVEQRAGRALGQVARHGLVDEVDDLGLDGRLAQGGGGCWTWRLDQPEGFLPMRWPRRWAL
jgi:hypothetical protein